VNRFTKLLSLCILAALADDFREHINPRLLSPLFTRAAGMAILRVPKMVSSPRSFHPAAIESLPPPATLFSGSCSTITCALPFEFSSSPWLLSPSFRWLRHSPLPPRPQAAMPICNWSSCSAATASARPLRTPRRKLSTPLHPGPHGMCLRVISLRTAIN